MFGFYLLKKFKDYVLVEQRIVKDFYNILNQVNAEEVPADVKIPENFTQLVSELKSNTYSVKDFATILKGMVCFEFRL